MDDLVRVLLIGALAAALVGCSSAPQQRHQGFEYGGRGLYQTHYEQSSQVHSKRRVLHGRAITANKTKARHRKNNRSTKIAEPHVVRKMDASSFVPPGEKSSIVTTTPPITTKKETPPSSQLNDEAQKTEIPPASPLNDEPKTEIPPSSPLNDQAKKTEIPPSSQLDDESVIKKAKATIAAKMSDPNSVELEKIKRAARNNALGNSIEAICGTVRDKNSGPRPFLYLIQTNEAYIGGYAIATSEYRDICSGK
jgi:hypothetical protein